MICTPAPENFPETVQCQHSMGQTRTNRMNSIFKAIPFRARIAALFLISIQATGLSDNPTIVVLHPLLEEMTRSLAGDQVEIINILPSRANVHHFEPSPRDMTHLHSADLVLAMGKNLEIYLDRLRANLPSDIVLYEVGEPVTARVVEDNSHCASDGSDHSHGVIDPHWWHSPQAMRRAVRHLGRELEERFPDNRDLIRSRTREKMRSLRDLHEWADETLSLIPASQRKLVTSHAAFGYFCRDFNFEMITVRGLTSEHNPSPAHMARMTEDLKKNNIQAVFPEVNANNALVKSLHESTGVILGQPLHADFQSGESYEKMFRSNIMSIVSALGHTENP